MTSYTWPSVSDTLSSVRYCAVAYTSATIVGKIDLFLFGTEPLKIIKFPYKSTINQQVQRSLWLLYRFTIYNNNICIYKNNICNNNNI